MVEWRLRDFLEKVQKYFLPVWDADLSTFGVQLYILFLRPDGDWVNCTFSRDLASKCFSKIIYFYRTRARSLGMLVTNSLTHSVTFSKLDWLWAQGFVKIRSWILSKILKLGLVKILSLSLVKFLKLKFDQDLCQKLWYELNPRVRCAFGNVFHWGLPLPKRMIFWEKISKEHLRGMSNQGMHLIATFDH